MALRLLMPAAVLAAALLGYPPAPLAAQDQTVAAAEAPPPVIPTGAFAASSPFSTSVRLSPDGQRIAFSYDDEGGTFVGTYLIAEDRVERRIPLPDFQELRWLSWAGSNRLLMSLAARTSILSTSIRLTRLYVADLADDSIRYIGHERQGIVGDDVIYVDSAGEFVLLAMQRDLLLEPEVWRFPLDGSDDRGEKVEGRNGVWQWVADDDGVVRLGLGMQGGRLRVWYRKDASESFRLVARLREDDEEELWDLVRLVAGKDEGYAIEPGPSGRLALRRFNYATREIGEVIYENPEWDVEDVLLDDDGEPLAVYFTDDRPRIVWLDPDLARLQQRLEGALAADRVWITDRAEDDSRILLWKGGTTDPGAWYFFTPATRQLVEFAALRPNLAPAMLAQGRPVEYTARDGTRIRAYLTLPKGRPAKDLPLIVLPHGGPYGIRDTLEYSDEVQLLANRGYAVLQPNYRGSGGFGKPFEELGEGQIGRRMQDDLDDAMDWAVAEGIADPARVCLVGSSYGGYAALWGAIRNPERYRCAASFAGVTEFDKQLAYDADYLSRRGRRAWRERVRGEERSFDLDSVSPARQAERLTRPILLVHGRQDNRVPFEQFEVMRDAVRDAGVADAEFVELKEAGHGFTNSADRQAWFDALVGFLAKHNPPD